MYFEKFRTKIALKRHALRDVIMLFLKTSLVKKRETGVLMEKCIKWMYEKANHVINIII